MVSLTLLLPLERMARVHNEVPTDRTNSKAAKYWKNVKEAFIAVKKQKAYK